jgi:y4mF family transcriptional regulator
MSYLRSMNPLDTQTVAAFVRARRTLLKLTQPALAEIAGVGLRFIRELEQGKPTLRMDKVNQVLRIFGHTLAPVPADRDLLFPDSGPSSAAAPGSTAPARTTATAARTASPATRGTRRTPR